MNSQVGLEAKKLESKIIDGNYHCSLYFPAFRDSFHSEAPTASTSIVKNENNVDEMCATVYFFTVSLLPVSARMFTFYCLRLKKIASSVKKRHRVCYVQVTGTAFLCVNTFTTILYTKI